MVDMMVLMGDKSSFGVVPMGEGHTYGFGVVDAERFEDSLAGRLQRFRRRFAEFGAPIPTYLAALQSDHDRLTPSQSASAANGTPSPWASVALKRRAPRSNLINRASGFAANESVPLITIRISRP
jgi:hypothetical protein